VVVVVALVGGRYRQETTGMMFCSSKEWNGRGEEGGKFSPLRGFESRYHILYSTMESEIIEPCVLGSPKFPSLEKGGEGGSAKNTAKGGIFSLFER